jgi:transglutaminase-like putative cysteine protease
MKLQIEHTTSFTYDEPIGEAYTEMRLRPLDTATQRCLSFKLKTEPRGEVMHYTDRFGNLVHHFDALHSHDRVVVKAESKISVSQQFTDEQLELSPIDLFDYLAPTNYAPLDEQVLRFASPHVVAGDATATALQLMKKLYSSMKYERGATDVTTTALEALVLGRGVCQDFAHVMLAACRSVGIPARYVSGYLHSSKSASDENGSTPDNSASHAWVDVFSNGRGWISLDPTHGSEQTEHYVRVAVGRDYTDVPPTRGVYKGKAKENLSVNVRVTTI